MEGKHISRSPFSVSAKSPVLRSPILTLSRIEFPRGVAINHSGEVVVTEHAAGRVFVFRADGYMLRSFGSRGSGLGQFKRAGGVAVDAGGNIFIVDNGNHRIQKFTSEGLFLTAVGTKGTGHLQFDYPRGIAFNTSNDKLYVTDNHRVQILKL